MTAHLPGILLKELMSTQEKALRKLKYRLELAFQIKGNGRMRRFGILLQEIHMCQEKKVKLKQISAGMNQQINGGEKEWHKKH